MKRFFIVAAAGLAFATPAWADDCHDGTTLGSSSNKCIDVYDNAIGENELSNEVKAKLNKPQPNIDAFHATDNNGGESKHDQAIAVGKGSTAAGYGATVGSYNACAVGQSVIGTKCYAPGDLNPNGTPRPNTGVSLNNPADPKSYSPVDNGTAIGAGAIVSHNGSTAVGAGAKSVKANEVVLGTEKTTVRAPSIPQTTVAATGLVTHDAAGNLGTDGGQTFSTVSAHGALLSQHSATLEEHARGIAIAMALPDAWIESNKRFAIAGSVGGFGDETALGAAAILRLDDVWSVNGKLGSDTGFEEFGWQVGARASW